MRTVLKNVYPARLQNLPEAHAWPAVPSELFVCYAQVALVLALLAAARLAAGVVYLGAILAHLAMFWQLWGPLTRADRHHAPVSALGLTLAGLGQELAAAALVAALVLPLWAWGLHLGRPWLALHGLVAAHPPQGWTPWGIGELVLTHVLGVALPEEVFWRGYVTPVLAGRWPAPRGPFGLALDGATLAACGLFALGHVVGGAQPAALATFAPALLFAALRARAGRVTGAIALHSACNLAAAAMA